MASERAPRVAQAPFVAVIAAGGAIGACSRYGVSVWIPHPNDAFPWATLLTNASGCLLIGVLMVLVTEVWSAHRLLRPFLGVGILGGYTTFSTYTVEVRALLVGGHAGLGFAYLAATVLCVLAAGWLGMSGTRWAVRRRTTDRSLP